MSCMLLYACPPEEDDDLISNCDLNELSLTEKEVVSPSTGASYLNDLVFTSIQTSSSKITIGAILKVNQSTINIEVENFSLLEGTQYLSKNPFGKIKNGGNTYTTSYQSNGQSSYVIDPKGEIFISNINKDCNSISGAIFIQAYTFSSSLGEIRFSMKLDFKNVPLDNKLYNL